MSALDSGSAAAPKVSPESLALRAPPRAVMRLNRRTLILAATGLAVVVAISAIWALRPQHGRHGPASPSELYNVDRVAKADDLDRLPADYSKLPPRPANAAEPTPAPPELGPPLPGELGGSVLRASGNAPSSVDHLAAGGAGAGQRDAIDVARSPVFFRTSSTENSAATGASPTPTASAAPNSLAGPFSPMSSAQSATSVQLNDPTTIQNRQDQKEAFLAGGSEAITRNAGNVQSAASPYTVTAGTVIPAALVTGINSDLPGQVIATVTQPIYDTATGRYLLIPQGSRLIGRYDSQVAFGQQRVLLVWLRIILPDTSSIALDKLPGIDQAGYAGVEDGVDWHWGRILAGAALATMLGVSSELAVSDQGSTNGNTVIALRNSAQDTTNQVGQEITRRNLSVQPTLTVRPGFPMDVMVNKDLVLRPYQSLFFQRGPLQ
jgi:type IV secretory pathway VirB10-like protein